jgi:hypothetical protein
LLLVDFLQCSITAGFRNNFQEHKRLSVCILRVNSALQGLWSGLLKGYSKLEASKNLDFNFSIKNLKNHQRIYKNTNLIC